MGSDISFDQFETVLEGHNWFVTQPEIVKVLLFEYYVFKIKEKELKKENKTVKALAEFIRKTVVKISKETKVEHINPLIDEKPEFASSRTELRNRALELAIKEAIKREASESSSYDDRSHGSSSRHYGKSGARKERSRTHHHRSHHHHRKASTSPPAKKESRRSRSRSRSPKIPS